VSIAKLIFLFLLLFAPVAAETTSNILFLMQSGNSEKAIENYLQYYAEVGHHDPEVVQQIAFILLDQGFRNADPEANLLTLFGAGISLNERVSYILEEGISSSLPQIQLVSLNFLATLQTDVADAAINRAMASDFLQVRLEAAHHLCMKKHPKALGQVEALMCKVDPQLFPIFPQFYAQLGDVASVRILRRMMSNPDQEVRIEAILNAAKHGRDDLLPRIRSLSMQHHSGQQEAAAFAMGVLRDSNALPRLEQLAKGKTAMVRLSALRSLYKLGKQDSAKDIRKAAKEGDLFAITLLGEIPDSEPLLISLLKDKQFQVRINAALALLELEDPHCASALCDILIYDARDLALLKVSSAGRSLVSWKPIVSAKQNLEENPMAYELAFHYRDAILQKTMDLPEEIFIQLADLLLQRQQHDLVPTLVACLETSHSPGAIRLLKKYQKQIGAPLIRNYCNLALYRLGEEGPYEENLHSWIAAQQHNDLIQFRPLLPWDLRDSDSPYQLTPTETSHLLVASIEALTQRQDEVAITALLKMIQKGNAKNRYALAGLLLRATE
jgi:HEAT repeat protein